MCEEMDQVHQCTVQWDVSDYHVYVCSLSLKATSSLRMDNRATIET